MTAAHGRASNGNLGTRLSALAVERELLRLRFAVSRVRMQTALANLQGEAAQSTPARAMAWVRSPWVRGFAVLAGVAVLLGVFRHFGWRRAVGWVSRSVSVWQMVLPLIGVLGLKGHQHHASESAPQPAAPAQAAAVP